MRVLLANKFYYRRGGDCIYMINLEGLLTAHGHETAVFAMDYPENLNTPWKKYFPSAMSKLNAFTRPFGDRETKRKFTALMDNFHPDVVHLNNIHTHLSPVIAEIAHRKGAKVVWTLHDYKLLCPRYDCLRNGESCELCFDPKSKRNCLKYSCIKGSKIGSWIGYKEAKKWNRSRLEAITDCFICPSSFMANKMMQGGFNSDKLKTLCNFIDIKKCKREDKYLKDNYYCYIGRISHEKGVRTLISAASKLPYRLVVVGDGPLAGTLKANSHKNVEFVGHKKWEDIKKIVGEAKFSVIPSECYENNPLSVIEAKCLGTPVLGARIGGIPELIDEGKNGMTFTSHDANDLMQKIQNMMDTSFNYQNIARESQKKYNDTSYYNNLLAIYEDCLNK